MRYDDPENIEAYKAKIGLSGQGHKNRRSFMEFLKWYLAVDLKDWTNYVAIAIAGILLWWGIKTIVKSLAIT